MIPAQHNLPDVYRGDTMEEIRFSLIKNGNPIDLTGAAIKCDFKLNKPGSQIERFSTDNKKILITNAVEGKFSIKSLVINFPAGAYFYDIEVKFGDGTVSIFVKGTLNVIQDITNCLVLNWVYFSFQTSLLPSIFCLLPYSHQSRASPSGLFIPSFMLQERA